jgi:FAD/FMN-containing dehydrogenase
MTAVAAGPGELTGRVVRPDDIDYAAAAAGWNLLYAHRPSVIVFAQETRDVVNAVAWALRRRIPVRVRSGRHCL